LKVIVEPTRIQVDPQTIVGPLLEQAKKASIVLESDGLLYRLHQAEPEDIWAGYDPEAVKRALRRSAGAFTGMDTKQLKRDILAQREQDSHGRPA
jgi:hypothetical protein